MHAKPDGVSVVIPTLERAEVLLQTLRDISQQSFSMFEVVVVDQSEMPNAAAQEMLLSYPVPARYFHVTHFRGLPDARNFGLQLARYDVVLYIDDDIRCGPGLVEAHYHAHLRSGVTMVAGGITEAKGDATQKGRTGSFNWWTASPVANYHLDIAGWCLSGKGCNFSVKKSALEHVGSFDSNLTMGAALYEETELGLRLHAAGYRCWFAPEAHLTHLAAPMGGCRVGPDIRRYVWGMAHNRAILIFRHLKWWHRPTAIMRMLFYGISYSRAAHSPAPVVAAIKGLIAGRKASASILNAGHADAFRDHA